MRASDTESFLQFLGLCKRAGKVVVGSELICMELRRRKSMELIVCSQHASDATKKRLEDKCSFYGKEIIYVDADTVRLGRSVGKDAAVAAVGVTDKGFADALKARADRGND